MSSLLQQAVVMLIAAACALNLRALTLPRRAFTVEVPPEVLLTPRESARAALVLVRTFERRSPATDIGRNGRPHVRGHDAGRAVPETGLKTFERAIPV